MGKNVFLLTSKHRIINSRTRHSSLANDITDQNTHFYWFLKSHDKRPLLPYTLHYILERLNFLLHAQQSRALALQGCHLVSQEKTLAIISTSTCIKIYCTDILYLCDVCCVTSTVTQRFCCNSGLINKNYYHYYCLLLTSSLEGFFYSLRLNNCCMLKKKTKHIKT